MSVKGVTHQQRRNLANLVLSNGYDVLREFWGELLDGRGWHEGVEVPPQYIAYDILQGWHQHMIDLADKVTK